MLKISNNINANNKRPSSASSAMSTRSSVAHTRGTSTGEFGQLSWLQPSDPEDSSTDDDEDDDDDDERTANSGIFAMDELDSTQSPSVASRSSAALPTPLSPLSPYTQLTSPLGRSLLTTVGVGRTPLLTALPLPPRPPVPQPLPPPSPRQLSPFTLQPKLSSSLPATLPTFTLERAVARPANSVFLSRSPLRTGISILARNEPSSACNTIKEIPFTAPLLAAALKQQETQSATASSEQSLTTNSLTYSVSVSVASTESPMSDGSPTFEAETSTELSDEARSPITPNSPNTGDSSTQQQQPQHHSDASVITAATYHYRHHHMRLNNDELSPHLSSSLPNSHILPSPSSAWTDISPPPPHFL